MPEVTETAPVFTLGEQRTMVRYSDNEQQKSDIQTIRNMSAELINFLESHKRNRIGIEWEEARVYAQAMTQIEDACMWSIKAICK